MGRAPSKRPQSLQILKPRTTAKETNKIIKKIIRTTKTTRTIRIIKVETRRM